MKSKFLKNTRIITGLIILAWSFYRVSQSTFFLGRPSFVNLYGSLLWGGFFIIPLIGLIFLCISWWNKPFRIIGSVFLISIATFGWSFYDRYNNPKYYEMHIKDAIFEDNIIKAKKILSSNSLSQSFFDSYFDLAANRGQAEMAELFLDSGAQVNRKDPVGTPVLNKVVRQLAVPLSGITGVKRDYRATTELLIERGANPRLKDKFGRTALDILRETRDVEAINYYEDLIKEKDLK